MRDLPDRCLDRLDLRTLSNDEWDRLKRRLQDRAHAERAATMWAALRRLFAWLAGLGRVADAPAPLAGSRPSRHGF